MTIQPIKPTFCGLKGTINAHRNMHKISNMAKGIFYMEGKQTGSDGAFTMEGGRVLYPRQAREIDPMNKMPEMHASYIVNYSPKEGLKTEIKSLNYENTSYVITQKTKKEEPVIDIFYKGKKVDENGLTEDRLETFTPLQNNLNEILKNKTRIQKTLGEVIPTLKDIK